MNQDLDATSILHACEINIYKDLHEKRLFLR
jgi:hypothetical protein